MELRVAVLDRAEVGMRQIAVVDWQEQGVELRGEMPTVEARQ